MWNRQSSSPHAVHVSWRVLLYRPRIRSPGVRDLRSVLVDNAWNRDRQESEASLAKCKATLEKMLSGFITSRRAKVAQNLFGCTGRYARSAPLISSNCGYRRGTGVHRRWQRDRTLLRASLFHGERHTLVGHTCIPPPKSSSQHLKNLLRDRIPVEFRSFRLGRDERTQLQKSVLPSRLKKMSHLLSRGSRFRN
jgi:hypothetical protein